MIVGLGLGVAASSHFTVSAVAEVIRRKIDIASITNSVIDTAQSKFGGSSVFINGWLDTNSQVLTFGTGDFTIECWARPSASLANNGIFHISPSGFSQSGSPTSRGLALAFYNQGANGFNYYGGNANWGAAFGSTHNANTWYHLAMVRSSGTLKIYVNGTSEVSIADTVNYTAHRIVIGGYYSTSFTMSGHIDEFRISNSARYTANFTPQTTPFVNDENTLVLWHMDGTNNSKVIEDDNGVRNKSGVYSTGANISTNQSKFGGTSAYFDGTSVDLITYRDSISPGTGDFTLEGWVYFLGVPSTGDSGFMIFWISSGSNYLSLYGTNKLQLAIGGKYGSVTLPVTPAINTWYHLAAVRSSGTYKVYWNGVDCGAFTNDSGWPASGTATWLPSGGSFGKFTDVRGDWYGYMDELRISNSARYTSNFTPPTAPFVNDANTLLLIHCDGTNNSTVFEDDNGVRSKKGIQAVGNAQVDTAQSKFGGASAQFDGTGDYLLIPNSTPLGTNPWTIEYWVRFNSVASFPIMFDTRTDNSDLTGYSDYINGSGKLVVFMNSLDRIVSTTTFTTGVWYHIAIVRDTSNNIKLYINGTNEGSTYSHSSNMTSIRNLIGTNSNQANFLNGWIDEVRISNTARYTANFTPQTTPFQNDSNTLLLLHMDGTDGSTVFTDDNGVPPDYDYGA